MADTRPSDPSERSPRADVPAAGPWRDACRLAVGTLTALPVSPPSVIDRVRAGRAMSLAPVAALAPALAAGASGAAATLAGLAALPSAALGLATAALATRGLHLDGLADTADGLAAAYDRDRALDVMRRGDSGPAGVAMLVLTLLVQVTAAAAAVEAWGAAALVVAVVAGRVTLPLACSRGIPAARSGGLGATVAESVPRAVAAVVVVATAGVCAGFLAAAGVVPSWADALLDTPDGAVRGTFAGFAAVTAALVPAVLLLRRCRRRLGGITGDVLGACVELGVTAGLVVLAAAA